VSSNSRSEPDRPCTPQLSTDTDHNLDTGTPH
jgi:hypothetical protein